MVTKISIAANGYRVAPALVEVARIDNDLCRITATVSFFAKVCDSLGDVEYKIASALVLECVEVES
jgi:hypothetical protein